MTTNSQIIDQYVDVDFGALNLVETHFMAALNGGPMESKIMREWIGHIPDTEIENFN